jgi:hypothetical protein
MSFEINDWTRLGFEASIAAVRTLHWPVEPCGSSTDAIQVT